MKEIWKDVKGYEDIYLVSNLGHIKSLDRTVRRPKKGDLNIVGRILKPINHRSGYIQYTLSLFGKSKLFYAHRLVALSFLDHIEDKNEVNHIDGNKKNNNIKNLEWVNKSENQIHAYKTGLNFSNPIRGQKNHLSKLKDILIIEIRKNKKLSQKELSEKFGVNQSTISRILNSKTWNHI